MPGAGEWRDDNNGLNYCINFKKALTMGNSGAKEVDASFRSGDAARDVAFGPCTVVGWATNLSLFWLNCMCSNIVYI